MNESRPHWNENDHRDRIVEKDLKELTSLLISIRYTFLFGDSIIKTSKSACFGWSNFMLGKLVIFF